jgi:hypothetical protein
VITAPKRLKMTIKIAFHCDTFVSGCLSLPLIFIRLAITSIQPSKDTVSNRMRRLSRKESKLQEPASLSGFVHTRGARKARDGSMGVARYSPMHPCFDELSSSLQP